MDHRMKPINLIYFICFPIIGILMTGCATSPSKSTCDRIESWISQSNALLSKKNIRGHKKTIGHLTVNEVARNFYVMFSDDAFVPYFDKKYTELNKKN